MYNATVLADSVNPQGSRLLTVEATFPRFILAEVNTHRVFSRNSASSRAIPPEQIIKKVIENPFIPETFNKRVKGMGVGDELGAQETSTAKAMWLAGRDEAVNVARALLELDVDKSRINRLLEPFMWHTAIISSTKWDNFFALRDHPAAQPEFQILAQLMRERMRESSPVELKPGQWHTPLVTAEEARVGTPAWLAYVSAGRCARVSFDKQGEYEPPQDSYDRAKRLEANGHLSPFEHVARPGTHTDTATQLISNFNGGWVQLRKLIPHEANRVGYLESRPAWDR